MIFALFLDKGPATAKQAEDGIRDYGRSRGLGDVYKRQPEIFHDKLMIFALLLDKGPATAKHAEEG